MLLVIDLIWQLFSLHSSNGANPTLLALAGDSLEYWNMSGNILDGNFIQKQPFLSAPLYPYFVALLRALGLDIIGVVVVQILLRSLTAWLIARCSIKLFHNQALGFCSALVFLLLAEPAYFSTRILNSSLQLLLMSYMVFTYLRFREKPVFSSAANYGCTVGAAILAHPPLLAGIPFFGWQLFRSKSPRAVSALALFSILAVTATATLHNAVATSRSAGGTEFIAVSAQAGITFAHGNSAGANGTYKPLDGVSASRLKQNKDAYQIVKQETGSEGWAHTSDYYLKQGLHYLSNNPGEAVQLFLSKIRWMFAAKHYGDLFFISEEIDDGAWPRPIPHYNFLQVGWLLPLSIIGLLLLWRKGHHASLTLALLFLSAAAVVVVFWYSPRYRLPLVPVAAIVAPWAIFTISRSRKSIVATLALAPILLIEGSSAIDNFDPRDDAMHGSFSLNTGLNYMELKQYDLAIPRFEDAIANGQDKAVTHLALAESQVNLGKLFDLQRDPESADAMYNAAIKEYYRALELNPRKDDARQSLESVLRFMNRDAEATQVKNEGKKNKSQ